MPNAEDVVVRGFDLIQDSLIQHKSSPDAWLPIGVQQSDPGLGFRVAGARVGTGLRYYRANCRRLAGAGLDAYRGEEVGR